MDAPVPTAPPPSTAAPLGRRAFLPWIALGVAAILVFAGLSAAYVFGLFPFAGTGGPNHPPVAVIRASDLAPATYERVALNATASVDPDGDAMSYAWTLPGGNTSSSRFVNLTFTRAGTFRVALTVTDSHAAQGTDNVSLVVHPAALHVGTNVPFPPFDMYNATSGQFEGFDVDLTDNASARLAYAPVWQNFADFAALLSSVASGGVDMAAAAITSSGLIGAQRNLTMYFSVPYYTVTFGVLVKGSDNLTCPSNVCTPAALANRTVGVVTGTSEEYWVDANLVSPGYTSPGDVYTYAGMTPLLTALQAGSFEIAIVDSWAATRLANGTSFRVAGLIPTGEQYSLAFPKTDAGLALRDRMNAALQAMVSDGTLDALMAKWFTP